jgi:hypothetical protein
MNLANFALSLAYELERQTKRANRDANETYAQALDGGYRFDGGRLIQDEDTAWAECQRTGRLADACDDLVCEIEDMVAMRRDAA